MSRSPGKVSLGMGITLLSERRTRGGDALARALLGAEEPLSFDELLAAASDCTPGEVAAWLGHATAEGLVREVRSALGLRFALKARGRRILSAERRARQRARRSVANGRPSYA